MLFGTGALVPGTSRSLDKRWTKVGSSEFQPAQGGLKQTLLSHGIKLQGLMKNSGTLLERQTASTEAQGLPRSLDKLSGVIAIYTRAWSASLPYRC